MIVFKTRERYNQNVVALAEFAFAMIAALEGINRDCFNDFKLRVGMCNGPLVAGSDRNRRSCVDSVWHLACRLSGIVGAKKPQYDIWGNTVNVASRMDSTGVVSCLHVCSYARSRLNCRFSYEQYCSRCQKKRKRYYSKMVIRVNVVDQYLSRAKAQWRPILFGHVAIWCQHRHRISRRLEIHRQNNWPCRWWFKSDFVIVLQWLSPLNWTWMTCRKVSMMIIRTVFFLRSFPNLLVFSDENKTKQNKTENTWT
jgi:hypothetical protein